MLETTFEHTWDMLPNPFQKHPGTGEMITSHVSGRSADIQEIVTGGQSAIILLGAPNIGKKTLIRYLQRPPESDWSWRDELEDLREPLNLNDIHFVRIDLTPLEGIDDIESLLAPFIVQCTTALQSVWRGYTDVHTDQKGLRDILRRMTRESPDVRYFMILEKLERLQMPDMHPTKAQTTQERGLALLDDCGAFRLLVDLLDEFLQLGVILSMESLPSPRIGNQFRHVSADLARFRTMTLQVFTQRETQQFLAQLPEDFGVEWARQFRNVGGSEIFTEGEQSWLYKQVGTHPYLLQQLCLHTFNIKRKSALKHEAWSDLQKNDKDQLLENVTKELSIFLDSTWKRVKESLSTSSQETRDKFYNFIAESRGKSASDEVDPEIWKQLGLELRYILNSEGIVRYDLLQPIYYPGFMLLTYLAQKVQEQDQSTKFAMLPQPQSITSNANELIITLPDKQPVNLELSLLEFHLIRTLLQHPRRCTEEELMKATWGKIIGKQVFTQRMHHLRKKLREHTGGEEVIENRYGGYYLLNHAEWFHLS